MLQLLPLATFQPHEVIKVVWTSDKPYTPSDLQQYLQICKSKVESALEWLHIYNNLYKDIVIDYSQFCGWETEFIPTGILDNIIQSNSDDTHYKKESYVPDLAEENYEDDFQVALETADPDQVSNLALATINSCVYINSDNRRKHPIGKLVAALQAEKISEVNNKEAPSQSVITYWHQGQAQPLNDYKDLTFFTAAFPTLFLFGIGRHLPVSEVQKIAVSLKAWAQWVLSHHTRR